MEPLQDARPHVLHACNNAGVLSAELLADADQPLHAALYDLVVIGEAVSRLPEEIRVLAPEIPWGAVVGMRNHIVHAYWQIDATVADTIDRDLAHILEALDRLIPRVAGTPA